MKITDRILGFLFHEITETTFWRIDRKKRLILFGHGGIPGFAPAFGYCMEVPWKGKDFHTVVIGKGITDVHPTALLGVDLDDVVLEDEGRRGDGLVITEAGLYNQYTKELLIGRDKKKVEIAEGTVDINPFAFAYHQKIKVIECPSSLLRIGVSAFEGCRKLKYIYRIPSEAVIGRKALKGTSGVRIYFDRNPVQRKIYEMHPKSAISEHGRGFLMNGEFIFFAAEEQTNIDPTKFYRCKDLVDIKGGKSFLIGLRANGEVLYETIGTPCDVSNFYHAPFRFLQDSTFDRLKGWKDIREIKTLGDIAAGLDKNGLVYCTESENVNEPLKSISDIIGIEVLEQGIYGVKTDWSIVHIAGGKTDDEEHLLRFRYS